MGRLCSQHLFPPMVSWTCAQGSMTGQEQRNGYYCNKQERRLALSVFLLGASGQGGREGYLGRHDPLWQPANQGCLVHSAEFSNLQQCREPTGHAGMCAEGLLVCRPLQVLAACAPPSPNAECLCSALMIGV